LEKATGNRKVFPVAFFSVSITYGLYGISIRKIENYPYN